MVTINFLPWRERRRAYELKILRRLLLAVFIAVPVLLVSVHVVLLSWQHDVESKIAQEKTELLQRQYAKKLAGGQARRAPASVLEKMAAYRADTQRVFRTLGKPHHYHVCFTAYSRTNNRITITGNASSAAEFTEFLKHWEAAALFSEIRIEQLQRDPETQLMLFRMQAIERILIPSAMQQTKKLDDAL